MSRRTISKSGVPAALDRPYAFSQTCTWHGSPIVAAGRHPQNAQGETEQGLGCPFCGALVVETPSAAMWWARIHVQDKWWARIYSQDKLRPGYEVMVRWGQGRCFPDFDALEKAYRKATEE